MQDTTPPLIISPTQPKVFSKLKVATVLPNNEIAEQIQAGMVAALQRYEVVLPLTKLVLEEIAKSDKISLHNYDIVLGPVIAKELKTLLDLIILEHRKIKLQEEVKETPKILKDPRLITYTNQKIKQTAVPVSYLASFTDKLQTVLNFSQDSAIIFVAIHQQSEAQFAALNEIFAAYPKFVLVTYSNSPLEILPRLQSLNKSQKHALLLLEDKAHFSAEFLQLLDTEKLDHLSVIGLNIEEKLHPKLYYLKQLGAKFPYWKQLGFNSIRKVLGHNVSKVSWKIQ